MFWTDRKVSKRKMILSLAVLCIAAAGLVIGAQFNSTDASTAFSSTNSVVAAPSATFPAVAGSLGAIPDGPAACTSYGANRDVQFTVSGISGAISNVAVNFSMNVAHTWVGDLDVRLQAPGGAPEAVIFSRTGATTATATGLSSDFTTGVYSFADANPAAPTWWGAAATTPIPVGSGYRASTPGEVAGGGANALITPVFAGLTPAQANGTWTLRFKDHCSADTGSVGAANLIIDTSTVATDAPVDFNGDSRSDYVVVRNTGGGPSGQVTWFINNSSGGATGAWAWGLATDFFVSEDFDGDLKDDITVWRPGAATVASFYILQSQTNTARVEAFGQTGDDPTVVGDYSGDGKADLAVYRAGATAGAASTWYYRATPGGPVNFVPWGQNGDFPAPGDYDGDGKNDFVIQRNNGGGQAAFWRDLTTAPNDIVVFGTPTDVITPGDYDGDGKTDLATVRGIGGVINWFFRPSGGGADQQVPFGASATDFPTQGDYDGDGKTDQAVWRSGVFWIRNQATGAVSNFQLGASGDYPVANFNSH